MRKPKRPRVTRNCQTCGKEISVRPSEIEKGWGKFCSHTCSKLGSNNNFWGGGIKLSQGYVRLYTPDHPCADSLGYVAEHRLIVEKRIGRYLKPEEVVHHKNHIRNDNRPTNLQLLDNQNQHMSLHMKGNKSWQGKTHNKDTKDKMTLARRKYWEAKHAFYIRKRFYENT